MMMMRVILNQVMNTRLLLRLVLHQGRRRIRRDHRRTLESRRRLRILSLGLIRTRITLLVRRHRLRLRVLLTATSTRTIAVVQSM